MSGSDSFKPIETVYNGYRFRSRLEARWAVFFDALGIPYEYEVQGFDLEDLGWYLPDFYLPRQSVWVEIKPSGRPFYDHKCAALSSLGEDVLYITGSPWPGDYNIFLYETGEVFSSEAFKFALGRVTEEELWIVCDWATAMCLNPLDDSERYPLDDSPKLLDAYTAARQARFEHGEHGGRP